MKKWIAILFVGMFVLTGCTDNVGNGIESLEAGKYEEAKTSFQKEIENNRE